MASLTSAHSAGNVALMECNGIRGVCPVSHSPGFRYAVSGLQPVGANSPRRGSCTLWVFAHFAPFRADESAPTEIQCGSWQA